MRSAIIICLLVLGWAGLTFAGATYFEPLGEAEADDGCGLKIVGLLPDFPAARAGVEVGDRLVGFAGRRIRSQTEVNYLRFVNPAPGPIEVTVLRQGKLLTFKLPDVLPLHQIGCLLQPEAPDLVEALGRAGLSGEQLVAPLKALVKGGGEAPNPAAALAALRGLPPRAQAEVLRPAVAATPAATLLLQSYLLLYFDEWSAARQLLEDNREALATLPPFLARLATFYGQLAAQPPTAEAGFPLAQYDVEPEFVAWCYPWPGVRLGGGQFDPVFQVLWDKKQQDPKGNREELQRAASGYTGQGYVGQVRAALLDEENHGGWPYRSALIYTPEARKRTVEALKKRWADQPDDRLLTAFCLICPAAMDQDAGLFTPAYAVIVASGPACQGEADQLLGYCVGMWKKDPAWVQQHGAAAAALATPKPTAAAPAAVTGTAVYAWLQARSAALRFYQANLPSFCARTPWAVTAALQAPVDFSGVNAALEAALRGNDFEVTNQALALAALDWRFCPRAQDQVTRFVQAARRSPHGITFDRLNEVFAYLAATGNPVPFTPNIFNEYFYPVEQDLYESLGTTINALDPADPQLEKRAAQLYQAAGVPSICLLLARKLAAAGKAEAAYAYRMKVAALYHNLASLYLGPRNNYVRWKALRDFASVPGYEDDADWWREDALEERVDSGYVLAAMTDATRERFGEMIANLQKSLSPKLRRDEDQYLYQGRVYTDVASLRRDLLSNVLKAGQLTDRDLARLRKIEGLRQLLGN